MGYRQRVKRYKNITLVAVFLLLIPGCDPKKEHLMQGHTMGTTFNIKVVTGYFGSISGLKEKIEKRLEEINQSMSTYIEDSEISRFNEFHQVGVQFKISNDFYQVMKVGQKIHRLSERAWDGTVNPLVDLWGFGRGGRKNEMPREQQILLLLADVGFDQIEVREPGFLVKKRGSVTLDLSSIAKGYGVDQIAEVIRKEGFGDYLVEIGGEVYAGGYRTDGKPWRVGINRPQETAPANAVYKVVDLHDKAFATSGDYRNFFEFDGVRYSHVIDPRRGYPVSNGVVSVSIIADTCVLADALATAVMVMGPGKGIELVKRLDGVECLIVVEKPDGSLVDFYSEGFRVED